MTTTYELIFETEPIDEQLQDLIDDQFDALISRQGRSWFITLSADGVGAREAALSSAAALRALGVQVLRLAEDLVSRADIAERTGMTTQAVGQWVRGDRQAADPFPTPFSYVTGGVWLWGEVNDWLDRVHGKADGLAYPSRHDYSAVNYALTSLASAWVMGASLHKARVLWAAHSPSMAPRQLDVDDLTFFHGHTSVHIGLPSEERRSSFDDSPWELFGLAG